MLQMSGLKLRPRVRSFRYRPLFTTEEALQQCLPYYVELFERMKAAAGEPLVHAAAPVAPEG